MNELLESIRVKVIIMVYIKRRFINEERYSNSTGS
jgi:hypothetical protein